MTESFTTADGLTLRYRPRGDGPILVCHPGGPGFSSGYFTDDLGGLDRDFTLVFLDPRGTDGSDAPGDEQAYTTPHYVADVEALREHLGEQQLNLLGHSHGGVVAAAYAAAHPSRVRRLVLANALVGLHPDEMERIMLTHGDEPWYDAAREALAREEAEDYADEDELRELISRFWPMYFAHYDEDAREYVKRHIAAERPNPAPLRLFNAELEGGRADARAELARITAPTLVVTGELDFICGPACAADLAEIDGARTVIVEDCGHFTFVEEPKRWRREIAEFVR
jgi:proline-specific peptidase